jgi:hypothetical protein
MVKKTFTREQMYELVWQRPVDHLARELGKSGRGLKKMLDRILVPMPGRGEWERMRRGRPVQRPPLPKLDDPDRQRLEFEIPICNRRDQLPAHVVGLIEREYDPMFAIEVPERPARNDRRITVTHQYLLTQVPNSLGLVLAGPNCWSVEVAPGEVGRSMRIMTAIVRAADRRGWEIRPEDGANVIRLWGQSVAFRLLQRRRGERLQLVIDDLSGCVPVKFADRSGAPLEVQINRVFAAVVELLGRHAIAAEGAAGLALPLAPMETQSAEPSTVQDVRSATTARRAGESASPDAGHVLNGVADDEARELFSRYLRRRLNLQGEIEVAVEAVNSRLLEAGVQQDGQLTEEARRRLCDALAAEAQLFASTVTQAAQIAANGRCGAGSTGGESRRSQ